MAVLAIFASETRFILGHEASGTIEQLGDGVTHLSIGDTVALNPSNPCNRCAFCDKGLHQHCSDMRFMGSAMLRPHVQGTFRQQIVIPATHCVPVLSEASRSVAALSEPLAVCLHAANRVTGRQAYNSSENSRDENSRSESNSGMNSQSTGLKGKRVIVTGAGPIGCLCAAVARYHGAEDIVITDVESYTLSVALKMGANTAINVAESADGLLSYEKDKGYFDIGFECSGAETAVQQAINVLKPQSILVQVGNAGALAVPFNRLVPGELTIAGSFRFHEEFAQAVDLIDRKVIDVSPIVTERVPFESAAEAFHLASDRSRSVKVLLEF